MARGVALPCAIRRSVTPKLSRNPWLRARAIAPARNGYTRAPWRAMRALYTSRHLCSCTQYLNKRHAA
eukprot:1775166-Alexandrium_andersonii.AAC.1